MAFKTQLYIPNKKDYITGINRPAVDCILCSILQNDPAVKSLLVYKNDLCAACVNLYPYNAGHLMLFPLRHVKDPRELTVTEQSAMQTLLGKSLDILDKHYQPKGYNLGFNIGQASGASIEHLHQHIVPRYERELGFLDITAGTKIVIEDPQITMSKLKKAFDAP